MCMGMLMEMQLLEGLNRQEMSENCRDLSFNMTAYICRS